MEVVENNLAISLLKQLTTLKAYRKDREQVAKWVVDNKIVFPLLLKYCYQTDNEISYKAAWVLEIICLRKIELLLPYLDAFLENIPKIHKNQAVRPMAKICEILLIDFYSQKQKKTIPLLFLKKHRNQLVEICFDWLITEQKVACKAYAMQCLYLLGKEFPWVHPELKILLLKDFASQQPAFKARARHILNKLRKI